MEIIIHAFLTSIWWAASLTILLPFVLLLKFSKAFQNRWFSFVFENVIGPIFKPKVHPLRKRGFELLGNSLTSKRPSYLEILEIGIGSGSNLQFYPPNSRLTALDMNATFEAYFLKNAKKYPDITHKETIISMAENMKGKVEDNCMDIVICTSVLCSVSDVSAVLSEVKRVLKPGGKFLFIEHGAYQNCNWRYAIQLFAAPLWHLYFNGCNLCRDVEHEIQKVGFSSFTIERVDIDVPFLFVRPHIVGLAIK